MPRSGACFPRVETSGGTSAVRPPLHPGGHQSRRVGPVREVSFPSKQAQPRRRPTKQLSSRAARWASAAVKRTESEYNPRGPNPPYRFPQSRRVGPGREISFPNKHAQPRRRPTKQLRSATPSLRLFSATNTSPQPGPRASPRFGSTHPQRRHLTRAPVQDSASRPSSRSRARPQTPGHSPHISFPKFFPGSKNAKTEPKQPFFRDPAATLLPQPKISAHFIPLAYSGSPLLSLSYWQLRTRRRSGLPLVWVLSCRLPRPLQQTSGPNIWWPTYSP